MGSCCGPKGPKEDAHTQTHTQAHRLTGTQRHTDTQANRHTERQADKEAFFPDRREARPHVLKYGEASEDLKINKRQKDRGAERQRVVAKGDRDRQRQAGRPAGFFLFLFFCFDGVS